MDWSEEQLLRGLSDLLPADRILTGTAVQRTYATDSYTVDKSKPTVVVLPETTQEVQAVMRLCYSLGVPLTPRGLEPG